VDAQHFPRSAAFITDKGRPGSAAASIRPAAILQQPFLQRPSTRSNAPRPAGNARRAWVIPSWERAGAQLDM